MVRRALALFALLAAAFGLWRVVAPAAKAAPVAAVPAASKLVVHGRISDAAAARQVKRSSFEPRKANAAATHRMPTKAQLRAFLKQSDMPYAKYVTGHYTGTTDEVIQWAADKWGFSPDLLRAVAVVETWWKMSMVGDNGDSFGLFQVRRPYHCKEPVCAQFRNDAAFNADYYGGILRAYYDGKQSWLNDVASENGKHYDAGDVWGSVGAWYSGRWFNDAARQYIKKVQDALAHRTWRSKDFLNG
jgi:hypothetical protein